MGVLPGGEDFLVVGEGWGDLGGVSPGGVAGFGAWGEVAAGGAGAPGDEDYGVAAAGPDAEEVGELDFDACFFADFALCGVADVFAGVDEAGGPGPGAEFGLVVALHVEEASVGVLDEDDDGEFGVEVVDEGAGGAPGSSVVAAVGAEGGCAVWAEAWGVVHGRGAGWSVDAQLSGGGGRVCEWGCGGSVMGGRLAEAGGGARGASVWSMGVDRCGGERRGVGGVSVWVGG